MVNLFIKFGYDAYNSVQQVKVEVITNKTLQKALANKMLMIRIEPRVHW